MSMIHRKTIPNQTDHHHLSYLSFIFWQPGIRSWVLWNRYDEVLPERRHYLRSSHNCYWMNFQFAILLCLHSLCGSLLSISLSPTLFKSLYISIVASVSWTWLCWTAEARWTFCWGSWSMARPLTFEWRTFRSNFGIRITPHDCRR